MPPQAQVEIGAKSDIGKKRENNEDHYLALRRRRSRAVLATNLPEGVLDTVDEDAYVMVVADGMGGRAFGELASQIALRAGWEIGGPALKWSAATTEQELHELEAKARVFFEMIDAAIASHAADQPEKEKMGTTLTIFYSVSTRGFVFHAGDSRAYLLSGGELVRLTKDHTVAQQLADDGAISQQAVSKNPFRNVLTNYVGGATGELRVDVTTVDLNDGDSVMLCSDGLTDMVGEPEIRNALAAAAGAQQACDALVRLALAAGGRDNVTVVVARYKVPSQ
jgi:protein phosphatase